MLRSHTLGLLLGSIVLLLLRCSHQEETRVQPSFTPPDSLALQEIIADAPPHTPVMPYVKKELVDFIDLTALPSQRHILDDGRSRLHTGDAGVYRETGSAAGSFFSLRFHTPAFNKPHIIVIEYPDDAHRVMGFGVLENGMDNHPNIDNHIETGVRTGDGLPLSHNMQLHQFILWPYDEWPQLYCANLAPGSPAAISRIWVYRATASLPQPEITVPDSAQQRRIGPFIDAPYTMRPLFGRAPGNRQHVIDYLGMLGCNLLAVTTAGTRGITCQTNYFKDTSNDFDTLLTFCDQNDIEVISLFDPTSTNILNTLNTPQTNHAMSRKHWQDAILNFTQTYAAHPSLHGIAWGSAATSYTATDILPGLIQKDIAKTLAAHHNPVQQYVFFNAHQNDTHATNTPATIVSRWEKGQQPLAYYITRQVTQQWKDDELTPYHFWYKKGITPVRTWYPHTTALNASETALKNESFTTSAIATKSAAPGVPAALCVYTHATTHPLYLNPAQKQSWYPRATITPQIIASHHHVMRQLALPLAQTDGNILLYGGSVPRFSGAEDRMRNFITAFRSLPARTFKTISSENDPVVVRILRSKGHTYFYFINTLSEPVKLRTSIRNFYRITYWVTENPFDINTERMIITLQPYELAVFHANKGFALKNIRSKFPPAELKKIRQKKKQLQSLLKKAKKEHIPLSPRYKKLLKKVTIALQQHTYLAADKMLAPLLLHTLSQRITQKNDKPVYPCRRLSAPLRLDGYLNEWHTTHTVSLDKEAQLTDTQQAPNHWSGPADYQATFQLQHNQKNLMLSATITDNAVHMGEEITLLFTRTRHRGLNDTLHYEYEETIYCAPIDADTLIIDLQGGGKAFTRRTAIGYTVEAYIPLHAFGVNADTTDSFGCTILFKDMDHPQFLKPYGNTLRDNIFAWPTVARHEHNSDPRTAIEIRLVD